MNPQADKGFNFKNYFCIPSFYDSHLHFEGIGKYYSKNNLSHIQTISELENYLGSLNVKANVQSLSSKEKHIEGFGLSLAVVKDLPSLFNLLKKYLNDFNFYLVLEDGHQLLFYGSEIGNYLKTISSEQKKSINYFEDVAIFNDFNRPQFDEYYHNMKFNREKTHSVHEQKMQLLSVAQRTVLTNGITHFRDMTSDPDQLLALLNLEKNQELDVFPELYYSNFFGEGIDSLIKKSKDAQFWCKDQKSKIVHGGLKIFLDGTFSQKSADTIAKSLWKNCGCSFLKESSSDQSCEVENHAMKNFLSQKDVQGLLRLASDSKIEIAFHTIGDLAVEKVIQAFEAVKENFKTKLHLEHCELMNSKTINLLKNLNIEDKNKITFHFQPSHYLMDKIQLNEISSQYPDLHILDWPILKSLGFKLFFGSDAPVSNLGIGYIEHLKSESLFKDYYSKAPFWSFFNHPKFANSPNTFTLFKNLKVESVIVQGRKII